MLERAFPGEHRQHHERDARTTGLVIAFVHSDVDPGAYYKVDTQQARRRLFCSRAALDRSAQMRPMERVALRARNGIALTGYLTRPRAATRPRSAHRAPCATLCIDVAILRISTGEAQLLASRGYAVLRLRGCAAPARSRAWQGAPSSARGCRTTSSTRRRAAIAQGIASSGNVCIYGAGDGGYAALMASVREPALYRCVASSAASPISSCCSTAMARDPSEAVKACAGSRARHGSRRAARALSG